MFNFVADPAFTFDATEAAQLEPAAIDIQIVDVGRMAPKRATFVDQHIPARFDPAMTFLLGLESAVPHLSKVSLGLKIEGFLHVGIQAGLVLLERNPRQTGA